MRKSAVKKIKLRKNNSVSRMPMGRGHNRARKTSKLIRKKNKTMGLSGINLKLLKNYMNAK